MFTYRLIPLKMTVSEWVKVTQTNDPQKISINYLTITIFK